MSRTASLASRISGLVSEIKSNPQKSSLTFYELLKKDSKSKSKSVEKPVKQNKYTTDEFVQALGQIAEQEESAEIFSQFITVKDGKIAVLLAQTEQNEAVKLFLEQAKKLDLQKKSSPSSLKDSMEEQDTEVQVDIISPPARKASSSFFRNLSFSRSNSSTPASGRASAALGSRPSSTSISPETHETSASPNFFERIITAQNSELVHLIAEKGDVAIACYLCEQINALEISQLERISHIHRLVYGAAKQGHHNVVCALFAKIKDEDKKIILTGDNFALLKMVAKHGHKDVAEFLLNENKTLVKTEENGRAFVEGWFAALRYAVVNDHDQIVGLFLQAARSAEAEVKGSGADYRRSLRAKFLMADNNQIFFDAIDGAAVDGATVKSLELLFAQIPHKDFAKQLFEEAGDNLKKALKGKNPELQKIFVEQAKKFGLEFEVSPSASPNKPAVDDRVRVSTATV